MLRDGATGGGPVRLHTALCPFLSGLYLVPVPMAAAGSLLIGSALVVVSSLFWFHRLLCPYSKYICSLCIGRNCLKEFYFLGYIECRCFWSPYI